jgi:uncharacterized membrane protein (UPF0182 family)
LPPRSPRTLPAVTAFLLIALFLPALIRFATDWLWFQEVGHAQVMVRSIAARLGIGAGVFALAFGVFMLNLDLARRSIRRLDIIRMTPEGMRTFSIDPRTLRPQMLAVSAGVALVIALSTSSGWETWLLYWNAEPFGTVDPLLGRDIGFYVFALPFFESLRNLAIVIVLLSLAGVIGAHVVAGNLGLTARRGLLVSHHARRHIAWLVAALFGVLAFSAWLGPPALLTTASTITHGASYADVHARIPALGLLLVASLAAATLAIYQTTLVRLWPIGAALAVYLVVAIGGTAYSAIIQRFVVAPNEQVRETPYIIHNVAATRAAFALDSVEERQLSGDAQLTRADIDANATTFENVPLWNRQPLLDTFSQIQEIRTYYDFVSVDNDRYTIDGKYRQIMLSARELNSESLPSRSWINEHLTFTHGYGLTLGPVNQVTREGLPVLFIKDLPPQSSVDLEVTEPAIYFGELSSDHVFVKTKTEEFDYPEGDDNKFASYKGDGGVSIAGLWRRLLFAIRFRSTDTLFSPSLTSESRVLLYRRIDERVRRIAPFLIYDKDPYLAIDQGRLVWIQDAYTTTTRYPYATPIGASGVNYIRNAIKVTIDAYHGHVRFYAIDAKDPIARTWARIFPGLLTPLEEMPEGLRSRLRYPQDIFTVQAAMYATYHMTNPAVFYNREDQWQVPVVESGGVSSQMEPYYTIMRLPGEADAEYIQMLPFTPRQKDNMAAWMVARSDGANYGQLVAFQFPKQKVIYGPRQVVARISQDQVISPQITLWNQQGSEVIQGQLLVIPVEESLIYIRPLYLRAAGGKIPELKRVIVAYQNQIVMEETLEVALARIFPQDGKRPATSAPQPPTGARAPATDATPSAARARDVFRRAIEAQRAGDWRRYGEEIEQLGEILEEMGGRPAAEPENAN